MATSKDLNCSKLSNLLIFAKKKIMKKSKVMNASNSKKNLVLKETASHKFVSGIEATGNAEIIAQFDRNVPALSCTILPDSDLMAVGWSDGIIEVRNTESFEEMSRMERSNGLPATFLSGFMSNDAKLVLLASYASGETVMWDAEERREIWMIKEDRQSLVNDVDSDCGCFAVGGSDAKINLYDIEKQKMKQVLQGSMDPEIMDGHTMRIFSIRFHPSRKHEIVSGGWDDTVQFWDRREPFSKRKIRGPHICGAGIEFFGDDKIITASWTRKNPLQIWDYGSGKLIENIKSEDWRCLLYFCRYVEPESILLLGGSHKNMLRVIDCDTFKTIATFQNLNGAAYFAKELPKDDPFSPTQNICFCSNSSIYIAEVEV